MLFWGAIIVFVALQAYIRLAPTDAARWHIDPFAASDPSPGGVKRLLTVPLDPQDALTRFAAIADTEPRTRRVAGSVDEGRLTYRTRTVFWGFPDFTTISARSDESGAEVVILARQRFGRSDFGVNARRADEWIKVAGF